MVQNPPATLGGKALTWSTGNIEDYTLGNCKFKRELDQTLNHISTQ